MKYAFTYIDLANNNINMETTNNWAMFWDYERNNEIKILHIEQTNDNWNTCIKVYDINNL